MRFIRVVLATLVAILLMGAGLLSAVAGVLAQRGRTSLTFDLLAHFAPIWLVAGLVAVLGGLAFRGRERLAICLVGLVGVAASGSLILPEFTRDAGPQAPTSAPGQIKLIQFNVWHHSPDLRKSLDWLAAQDPDIAVLEETTPALRDLVIAQNRWQIACPRCEVMILSKRPAADSSPLRLGRTPGPITRATFQDAHGAFTVIGVHNAWPTDEDQPMQEERLAQAIAMFPRDRTIVAGDFNSAPWSFARRRWDKAFGIPRRERALFSWPAQPNYGLGSLSDLPFLPLDHVYAGPGWATVSVKRGPRLGSDHYPVIVTLAPVSLR
jgi:endonuclease/exonuclease/phosphatase (EEP) superfamily protein YafD